MQDTKDRAEMEMETLNWVPVESSNIQEAAHDKQSGALFTKFSTGAVYRYSPDFGQQEFDAFMKAPSKGEFLNKVIKPNFDGVKVRNPTPKEKKGIFGD